MKLERNATDDQIRKQYKRMAIQLHPDKQGGSQEKFKELQMAYNILKDKEKREVYDKYGLKGVKEMD
jgi:DnaJ-class molecular chaperone